jgi:hypothetical protein
MRATWRTQASPEAASQPADPIKSSLYRSVNISAAMRTRPDGNAIREDDRVIADSIRLRDAPADGDAVGPVGFDGRADVTALAAQ